MKLVASMIMGPGERERYLPFVLASLATFCDDVILGDGSDFFEHEGRARQRLLDATLAANPTHILAIDCDELVSDGAALRAACESECPVLTLVMREVWQADSDQLRVREDGGWKSHLVPSLWRVPDQLDQTWRISDRQLACGREPIAVQALHRTRGCSEWSGVDLLHFGWTNAAERQERYDRYAVADGGRFHAGAHLQSILLPDSRVTLAPLDWPPALERLKADLLERVNQ